jgi:hypothetical protein
MGDIFNLKNLKAYMRKCNNGVAPNWPVDDLLYIRLPVLAVRNYFNNSSASNWTLTWEKGRNMTMAFQIAGSILGQWQAFRPKPPAKLLRRIEASFPGTVRRFQRRMLNDIKSKTVLDVKHDGKKCNALLIEMGLAIADIAHHKGVPNPMLASKLLNFFFPELFPVWDTGWIKKKALKHYRDIYLPENVQTRLSGLAQSKAALEYAEYVYLMLQDLWRTKPSELRRLRSACFSYCERKGYYEPQIAIEGNYNDITPLLFEMCLLGKHC